MRLYTEFEVKKMIEDMGSFSNGGIDYRINQMTPIDLPSNDQIWEKIEDSAYSLEYDTGFAQGVNWVIEQIKQKSIGH